MKPAKGYYSVIQYCPDLGRFEAANVGVLLFCPEKHFIRALTSNNNGRIIRFFGSEGHDLARINTFKRGLEDRLQKEVSTIKSVEDLQQFIALRANVLQITPPNSMKVCDPEEDLRNLFEEIIGEPARPERRRSLRGYVSEKFSGAGLEKKVVHDVKVDVPVLQRGGDPVWLPERPIQPDQPSPIRRTESRPVGRHRMQVCGRRAFAL